MLLGARSGSWEALLSNVPTNLVQLLAAYRFNELERDFDRTNPAYVGQPGVVALTEVLPDPGPREVPHQLLEAWTADDLGVAIARAEKRLHGIDLRIWVAVIRDRNERNEMASLLIDLIRQKNRVGRGARDRWFEQIVRHGIERLKLRRRVTASLQGEKEPPLGPFDDPHTSRWMK